MAVNPQLAKQLLRDLVAIDSVNPSLVPGARGESEAARFLRGWLGERGIESVLQEASDDPRISRPNVVAQIGAGSKAGGAESGAPTAGLMLVAHIDTVGAGDMRDPFAPREKNGCLFGRGALDIKSGVAAMCAAAAAIVQEGAALKKPLRIAAVVDEECNSLGTQKLVTQYSAEAAVVLEPTDLQVCIAHKGYGWIRLTTQGRAAHGSRPDEGRDAIVHMGRVLGGIENLDAALARRAPHPLLGRASVHASLIAGGHELSSYPAQCILQVERRTLPGENDAQILGEISAIIAALGTADDAFRAEANLLASRAAYEISESSAVATAATGALRKVTGSSAIAGASFWTDTALLAAAGIPGVVFGPRGKGLHAAEEYVEMDSVVTCAEVLREMALAMCA